MSNLATYELCSHPIETTSHVLRDCTFAKEVWSKVGGFNTLNESWQSVTDTWIRRGICSDRGLLFGIVCWYIWKSRNERIFSDARPIASSVAFRSVSWCQVVTEAEARNDQTNPIPRERQVVGVAWDPGPESWITLNTDGAVDHFGGRAAAGGLVRNSDGRCLLAFSMNLGNCSVTRAELRGAIEGLQRTWNAGYRNVIAQLDSRAAILILNSEDGVSNQFALEKAQFQELRGRGWNLVIKHTYREGNRAADYLASIGYDYPLGTHSISISECRLGYFLRYDCLGITEQRSILIND
ncbi:Putative ribonuclease H protein At1g65750 [Linum perenne]